MSGWLVLRPPGSKSSSNKRYFILLADFVLYSFRSEVEGHALTATPLPGYTVITGQALKGDSGCDIVVPLCHLYEYQGDNLIGFSGPEIGQMDTSD